MLSIILLMNDIFYINFFIYFFLVIMPFFLFSLILEFLYTVHILEKVRWNISLNMCLYCLHLMNRKGIDSFLTFLWTHHHSVPRPSILKTADYFIFFLSHKLLGWVCLLWHKVGSIWCANTASLISSVTLTVQWDVCSC